MSSSILLEGRIDPPEGDLSSCSWVGQWHFFRDSKIPLNFRYKRARSAIPLDLVHYVSFIANASGDLSARPRSRGRVKGWRKYRDQSGGNHQFSTGESAAAGGGMDDMIDRDFASEMMAGDDDGRDRAGSDDNADYGAREDSFKPTQVLLPLSDEHPLFGLYDGSFDVKTPQGPLAIPETFFLHAFAGIDDQPQPGLDVLPPTDWWTSAQLLKHMELDSLKIFGEMVRDRAISTDKVDGDGCYGAGANSESVLATEFRAGGAEEVTHQFNGGSDLCSGSRVAGANTPKSFIKAEVDSKTPDESSQWGSTINPAAYPDLDFLLGFGRNTYGRFSLFGVFNRCTGSLQCERKYLTGRTSGLKRNLKQGSLPGDMSGESTPGEPRMTTRTHRAPSLYMSEDISTTPRATSWEKKQRSYSTVSLIAEDAPFIGNPPSKRRRTQSSGGDLLGGEGPVSHNTPTGRGRSSSTSAPDSTTAVIESDRKFNDAHNAEIRYRPVYYDDETCSYYEGWWASGCRNGRGLCLYSDKLMYEGNWFMGRETGRGVLMTGNRKVLYRGDWVDGCFHGSGTYTFANGDIYKGDWREGKRHGKGEYFIKKYECTYVGDWKDNKRHGRGVFTWVDGSKYDGDWEKDCRHGRGILSLANGFYYDGSWDKNYFDGRGYCVFPNGQEYQGMFKNGMRDGRGSVTFAEGAVYEGRFREDKMDGQGTCKILRVLQGLNDEWMIPIDIQADMKRIHYKAGFGDEAH